MTDSAPPSIVWFRQDLRLADQPALTAAAAEGPVAAVYVLDDEAPGDWRIGAAQRWWLHHTLVALEASLRQLGVPLILRRGPAAEQILDVARQVGAASVHCISHYEPWWRDAEAAVAAEAKLVRHDGYLLIDPEQIRTGAGTGFRVFSPFWRALQERMPPPRPVAAPQKVTGVAKPPKSDRLADWKLLPDKPDWAAGFDDWKPGEAGANRNLKQFVKHEAGYKHDRDFPSIEGSSRLSPHLHMGEISPAAVWHAVAGKPGAEPFLRELAWRDFTSNLITQLPDYANVSGRPNMDRLKWRTGKAADRDFVAWTKGKTGYPIVDAGMRQLWQTGWMHNRVRMLTASFLIKHLLIDWRRGEKWFWDCLIDADYGNNSVNWQWVSGTGVDSSPFGRIMSPLSQSDKFDAAEYIRRWVPELARLGDGQIHDPHGLGVAPSGYADKLVSHGAGRERALAAIADTRG